MEVILKQDVKHLGDKDDIVKVKPGYGRNYLIPKGYAVQATESARKVLAENLKQAQFKQEKIRKDADAIAAAACACFRFISCCIRSVILSKVSSG